MNRFLASLEVTFRRDPTNFRPRVNKMNSVKDREQKCTSFAFPPMTFRVLTLTPSGRQLLLPRGVNDFRSSNKRPQWRFARLEHVEDDVVVRHGRRIASRTLHITVVVLSSCCIHLRGGQTAAMYRY